MAEYDCVGCDAIGLINIRRSSVVTQKDQISRQADFLSASLIKMNSNHFTCVALILYAFWFYTLLLEKSTASFLRQRPTCYLASSLSDYGTSRK